MRLPTIVLLACVGGWVLDTSARGVELEEGPASDLGASAPRDSLEAERMQAMGICEQTVAERLENPSAAHWPDRSRYRVTRQGSGQFAIDGYVDVQGALGDVRTPWTCRAIRGYGEQWQGVASLGESAPTAPPPSTAAAPAPAERVRPPAPDEPPAPRTEPAPAPFAAAPGPAGRESWSEVASCRRLHIRDAYAEKYPDRRMQIVKGVLEYSGTRPIRSVRVCASGTCTLVKGAYPPLQSGAREPFTLEVPSLDTVTVTAECSVLTHTTGP